VDATAELALMSKAKLVFETDADSFLCFPALSPLSYTPDQLKFVPATSDAAMPVLAELSRFTNALPQGVLFDSSLDTFLWDEYLHVLRDAQLAQGDLSAQQQADYQQAESFLYSKNPDGTTSGPSAALIAYNQYQQAYFQATQAYKAAQLTASASTDPAVQAQWNNTDEPKLAAQVQAAETAWETNGFKAQVEQAQQIEQSSMAESPALQWQTWASGCNPDIDFLTDGNNQSFGPTVYAPYNILDADWPPFTLTSTEIEQLVQQAPPELTKVLGDHQPSSNIAVPVSDTDQVVSSGQGTLRGTWMFSFDIGAEVGSTGSSDVWWEQMTNVDRQLVPKAPAGIVNLGNANFDAINLATLQGYQYGSTPIPGSANATNQLTPGDVFAVRTSGGNYAKVRVITYDYNLGLRWTTYKPPAAQDTSSGTSNIESLSFEFSSVKLCRPWFHPEVFAARFWRFANSAEHLSDGNVPASGDWPAYITALVFARNIVVTENTGSGAVNKPIQSLPPIVLRRPIVVPPIHNGPVVAHPAVVPTALPATRMIAADPMVISRPVEHPPAAAAVTAAQQARLTMRPAVMARLNAATFANVQVSKPPQQASPDGGTPSTTQTTSGGQVSILAFICKRLPKCPNPDSSLTWTDSPGSSGSGPSGRPTAS
jgi:hypothetical protein